MKDIETKHRFVELRAQDKSLRTAANELEIGLQTAVRWERELKEQIENLKAMETSPVLVEYDELSEELKKQNRLNVRDIPVKLAEAGYIMIPARSKDRPFSFSAKTFEKLAEAEHERWMQAMLDDGWSYASETDPEKKLNKCLLSWNKLPEEEKEKDRDLVRGIPDILARAGYAIVKSGM